MAGHTAWDALLAELLGDVGKLHDEVKGLEQRLPSLLENIEKQIVNYEETVSDMQSAWMAEIRRISQENHDAANRLSQALQSPDGLRSLCQADIKEALERVLSELPKQTRREEPGQLRQIEGWKAKGIQLLIVVLVGVTAGAVGGFVSRSHPESGTATLSQQDQLYLKAGHDIIQVMPHLDRATRQRLEEALAAEAR